MQVKLKVLQGKSQGQELPIRGPKFVIGRSEECQLRPKSDSVSRRHCLILLDDKQVTVQDLKSKNGTFINGERVEGQQPLKMGDRLRVGRVEFEVLIEYSLKGAKRPKVQNVKEAAARTVEDSVVDIDVSQWLEEGDEQDRARRLADPDTRQFRLDETERIVLEKAGEPSTLQGGVTVEQPGAANTDKSKSGNEKAKEEKKAPGKLPTKPVVTSADSCEAASAMLRKFFNR